MAHAILSPSGASRWLACTPSARLEQQFPDSSGDAAKEGTLAHSLGELLIRMQLGLIFKKQFTQQLAEIKADGFYGNEMQRYAEDYRDFVLERFAEAKMTTSDAVLFLEQKLNLTEYVPEGFGTGDCVIVADGLMDIIDLKYGKGVLVSADQNKQMMLYALGALREFDLAYDIDRVRMTIYQPRLDNFSSFEMTVADLFDWAMSDLKPRAAMAFAGEGDFVPGKHCGFCKAKAQCRALADYNLALARHEFKLPDLLTDAEVAEVLEKIELLTSWAKSVSGFALTEALGGKKWPGYKIVEGKSNRKFINPEAIAQKVIEGGWKAEDVWKKSLIGIGDMETLIGKADVNRMLGEFIVKPPGAPALVPVTDKRPEFNSAIADFS